MARGSLPSLTAHRRSRITDQVVKWARNGLQSRWVAWIPLRCPRVNAASEWRMDMVGARRQLYAGGPPAREAPARTKMLRASGAAFCNDAVTRRGVLQVGRRATSRTAAPFDVARPLLRPPRTGAVANVRPMLEMPAPAADPF